MKILHLCLLLQILILSKTSASELLPDSTKENLLIEQKTTYYLKHTEQCWDVVEDLILDIDTLEQDLAKQKQIANISDITAKTAIRLSSTLKQENESLSKENGRKRRNNKLLVKWGVFSTALAIIEGIIIYGNIKTMLR